MNETKDELWMKNNKSELVEMKTLLCFANMRKKNHVSWVSKLDLCVELWL
jgi:hypothetical protein